MFPTVEFIWCLLPCCCYMCTQNLVKSGLAFLWKRINSGRTSHNERKTSDDDWRKLIAIGLPDGVGWPKVVNKTIQYFLKAKKCLWSRNKIFSLYFKHLLQFFVNVKRSCSPCMNVKCMYRILLLHPSLSHLASN